MLVKDLIIVPEFKSFMPTMGQMDFEVLKASIKKAGGIVDPIETTTDKEVIDGHNRVRALEALGITEIPDKKVKVLQMPREAVFEYIFVKNVARRHLNDAQKVALATQFLPEIKKRIEDMAKKSRVETRKESSVPGTPAAKKKEESKKKKAPGAKGGVPGPTSKTRKEVAKLAGVSEDAVQKQMFLTKYNPDVLKEVEDNKIALRKAYDITNEKLNVVKNSGDEKLIEGVESGEIKLQDAYDTIAKEKPQVLEAPKKIDGPISKALKDLRGEIDKIIIKAHGGKDKEFKPTAPELSIVQKVDAFIKKYEGK